jgi:hypothetical protein
MMDIFQAAANGSVRWLETAATLQDARARVQVFRAPQPSEYLIFDQKTGRKIVVRLDGMVAPQQLNDPRAAAPQSVIQENPNGK